jgi:hypothetical protein
MIKNRERDSTGKAVSTREQEKEGPHRHLGTRHTQISIPTHGADPHMGQTHTWGRPTHGADPHMGQTHTSGRPTQHSTIDGTAQHEAHIKRIFTTPRHTSLTIWDAEKINSQF